VEDKRKAVKEARKAKKALTVTILFFQYLLEIFSNSYFEINIQKILLASMLSKKIKNYGRFCGIKNMDQ
jgi:hypothetical protein